jgi:hypothetical protein
MPAAVDELLSGLVQSKKQPDRRSFAASTVHLSPLAPHLDLQLQLQPQQLLQLVNEAASAAAQQQIQLQQQGEQPHQDKEQGEAPGILGPLHPDCQQQLLQLLTPWREAAAVLAAAMQESSSWDVFHASLLQDCMTLLELVGQQQQPQQQEQQQCQDQHAVHQGACGDAAAAAAAVSGSAAAPAGPDQAPCSNNSSSANGDCKECEVAARLTSLADTLFHRLSTYASCLVLQFIEDSCMSGGAANAPAWQQTVPLQALLLCSQLQQLHGAMQRCVAKLQGSTHPHPQQQQQQVEGHQQHGQQQQQGQQQEQEHQAAPLQQQSDQPQPSDAAHATAQPEQYITVLVEHVVGLLQSIRRFKDVNDAMGSTAAVSNGPTQVGWSPDAASSKTQSSSSSSNSSNNNRGNGLMNHTRPLDPISFFSAGGPLAGGVWGFQEPVGAGVWAPIDATAAGARLQKQQQQQQQHAQHQPCGPARDASSLASQHNSSSSVAATSAVPQQAWQVLLGCCAWQQALQLVDENLAANLQNTESMLQLQHHLFQGIRDVSASDKRAAEAYVQQFQALGIHDLDMPEVLRAYTVPHVLKKMVESMRGSALKRLGFDEDKWQRRRVFLAQRRLRQVELVQRLEDAGYGRRRDGGMLVFNREEIEQAQLKGVLPRDEDPAAFGKHVCEEDELDIMQRELDVESKVAKVVQRKVMAIEKELEALLAMVDDDIDLADASTYGTSSNNHSSELAAGSWGSGTSSSGMSSPRASPAASNGSSSATNGAAIATPCMPAAAAPAAATSHDGSSWALPEEVTKAEQAVRWVLH